MNKTAQHQNPPLFSIIIPTHNSGKTILSCLDSVAGQTTNNFELIVQDCLSSDDTILRISNFCQDNPSLLIKIFEESDLGVYDAMNKALQHASGQWIYFLGSDDQLYEATTLESVSKSINHEVYVIYGDVYRPCLGSRYAGRFSPHRLFNQNICHQSIFIRRIVFDRFGYFNLAFKIAADWEHNMRWFLDHSIKVIYIDQIIATFADGGLSSTTADLYFDSQKPFLFVYHGRKTLAIRTKALLIFGKLLHGIRRRDFRDILTAFRLTMYLLIPPVKLLR